MEFYFLFSLIIFHLKKFILTIFGISGIISSSDSIKAMREDTAMTVEEVRKIKRQLGWTNAKLAEEAGIPLSTVAKILGGTTRNPRQGSVEAMEKALKKVLYDHDMQKELSASVIREHNYVYGSAAAKSSDHSSRKISDSDRAETGGPGNRTVEDYLALPHDQRMELIDGHFYDMASPTGIHQQLVLQIWKAIDSCIEEHGSSCIAQVAPFDVQLFNDPYTVVQPDVMVFCTRPEEALSERARSAPDFIAEILSPSTAFRDRTQKLCRYRDAKVKEIWIVDPGKETIEVYRFYEGKDTPQIYTFHDAVPLGISGRRCSVDFSNILKHLKPESL